MAAKDFLNASLNNDEGKYTVPAPLSKELINNIIQFSGMLQLLRKWPMSNLSEKIPLLSTAAAASYTGTEGNKKVSTHPAFGQIELLAKELSATVVITEQLIENTNIDGLIEIIQEDLRNAFICAKEKEYAGYGGSVYASDLTTQTPADHIIAVGSYGDLLLALSAALGCIEEHGFFENIAWITHPAVKKSFRDLRDDNGQLLLQPATANSPETLYGYPIKYSTYFEKVGSPAKYELFVADWRKIIEGQRQELRLSRSSEASVVLADGTTVNLWQDNMVGIKGWLYAAFEIADVNCLAKVTGL